jgi:hypothetical protein
MPRRASPIVSPLRVAIDAHIVGEQETGNETHIVNLVRGLAAIDRETSYLLYSPHSESLDLCGPLPSTFVRRRIRPATSTLRIPFGIPDRVLADRADALHVTYAATPISSAHVQDQEVRRALTGHGLAHVKRFTNEATARASLDVYYRVAHRYEHAEHASQVAQTNQTARSGEVAAYAGS